LKHRANNTTLEMRKLKESYAKWANYVLPANIVEDTPYEKRRKVIMLYIISVVAVLTLLPLGAVAHFQGDGPLGFIDHFVALFLACNLIYIKNTGKIKFPIFAGVSIAAALFLFLFVTGGVKQTGHLWYYTFPLFSAFLLGAKDGAIATLILFGSALLFLGISPQNSEFFTTYENEFLIRFIPSFLVVFAYAYTFETLREKAQGKLVSKNAELVQKNELLNREVTVRQQAELEIRRAKEEAETANRAKSDFLANMSHELRTPLNHIIGFTEMVVDKRLGDLKTRQQKYLNNVLQSGWHLLSLVNDILDLSKVEAGKLELVPGPVNLKHLLQNSLVMVKEKAAKHGIRLSLDVDGVPESITADERKLKQIIYNLLSNAVKFTPDRGRVQCEARLSDENRDIEISVTDTGIGIQPDDLKRIFDPFEQVDGSSSRRFEGTGLGLSLTKKLVELHGGRIRAESDGVGKGAAFRFSIPL